MNSLLVLADLFFDSSPLKTVPILRAEISLINYQTRFVIVRKSSVRSPSSSLTLREVHRPMGFKKGVPRRVFGRKKEDVRGGGE